MNTLHLVKGLTALVLVTVPVLGIGCVAQTDSEEAVAEAQEAINPTLACPQGPGTALVATGAADGGFQANYANDCANGAVGRLGQYILNVNAPTDLGTQCRNHCTDNGRFPACGIGWRLDAASATDLEGFFTPFNTANLILLAERPGLGQSLSGTQAVTCINRLDVNAEGDDQHQWVAVCSCSNL